MSFPQPIYPGYVAGASFTPLSIANCALWFDPNDLSSMKQEITGASATTAVTTVGDPVGSWLNKGSLGGWAVAPTTGARPTLAQTVGGHYYLSMSGTTTLATQSSISAFTSASTWFSASLNTTTIWIDNRKTHDPSSGYWGVAQSGSGIAPDAGANVTTTGYRVNGSAVSPSTRGQVYTMASNINAVLTSTGITITADNISISGYTGAYIVGRYYGAAAYTAVLGSTDMASVESYFASKMT